MSVHRPPHGAGAAVRKRPGRFVLCSEPSHMPSSPRASTPLPSGTRGSPGTGPASLTPPLPPPPKCAPAVTFRLRTQVPAAPPPAGPGPVPTATSFRPCHPPQGHSRVPVPQARVAEEAAQLPAPVEGCRPGLPPAQAAPQGACPDLEGGSQRVSEARGGGSSLRTPPSCPPPVPGGRSSSLPHDGGAGQPRPVPGLGQTHSVTRS